MAGSKICTALPLLLLYVHSICADRTCSFLYSMQPVATQTCKAGAEGLKLVCQAHSTMGEEFDLLWFAQRLSDSAPYELKLSTVTTTTRSGLMINVTSTLCLGDTTTITKVFCQVRPMSQSLLSPSQAIVLQQLLNGPECNLTSLVNLTATCLVPQDMSGKQQVPVSLYGVVAVIAVFVVIILTLTIIIMLLYRRKCGDKGRRGSSSGSDATDGRPKRLHSTTSSTEKSSLDKRHLTVTFSDSTRSMGPLASPRDTTLTSHQTQPSLTGTQNGDMDQFLNIYRTLSQEQQGETVPQPYLEATVCVGVARTGELRDGMTNPNYMSTAMAGNNGHVVGEDFIRTRYEWSESHMTTPPSVMIAQDSKYRGDYERDPRYMEHVFLSSTGNPLLQQNSLSSDTEHAHMIRTDKYRGDYERSDTYVLPRLTPTTPTFISHDQQTRSHES